jgi:diacylglycerol kinase family enzyme
MAFIAGFGLYSLFVKHFLSASVACFGFFALIKSTLKVIAERNIIQLRITIDGIQVKEEPLIKWSDIENERIEKIIVDDGPDDHEFIFYDSNANQKHTVRVGKLNISEKELLKSAQMHRERFNRRNNPTIAQ